MKKIHLYIALCTITLALVSCEYLYAPIETGTDDSGIDGGIEWMYRVDAYPTYGVDRQRQKHYYTYDVTSAQVGEYIKSLLDAGYTITEVYGTAQPASGAPYPLGKYAGDEAYYVFTSADEEESIILTFIYQSDGTWISEVDS